MAELVYSLCGLTSVLCAALLYRTYWTEKRALLLWSSLCFILLAAANLLLFVDIVIFPDYPSLILIRHSITLAGICVMIYGLIKETV